MRPASVLIIALLASPAALAGPGEQAISLTTGYATFSDGEGDDEIRAHGGTLGLDYEYRATDAVSVRVSGSGGVFDADGRAYAGQGTLGLVYALDIIKYVPYVTGGVGGLYIAGDAVDNAAHLLVELGGGVDVLHSRSFSYGVALRYETLLQDTDYLTAAIRLTWRWGFF